MKDFDVLLFFPPNTEARLFPYLSLPMLQSYLKSKGFSVKLYDLNLALSKKCVLSDGVTRVLKHLNIKGKELSIQYRREMAYYFQSQKKAIYKAAFLKSTKNTLSASTAIRLAKQAFELVLESSIIRKVIPSLQETIKTVHLHEFLKQEDIAEEFVIESAKKILKTYRAQIIGFSVSFYSQLLPTLLLCKLIKTYNPDQFIILGGQQIMLRGAELAKDENISLYVDALCDGKGEETLEKLCLTFKNTINFEEVPQIKWLNKNYLTDKESPKPNVKFIDLPPPDFSGLPINSYLNEEFQIPLITCIGCYWGRCIFCSYGNRSFYNKDYQQLTPQKLADHCEQVIRATKATRINFVDENNNLKLILEGVRLLKQKGYSITFSTRNRMEKILTNMDFCKDLAEHGCVLMSCGYETVSQRLLDKMDKGVQASNYQQIIDNLHQVNILLRFSVMGGILDETPEEFLASKEFLKKNAEKIGIDVMQMLVAEPFTRLTTQPEIFGLQITSKEQLRGNELLNYSHGRMGYFYSYPNDSETFQEKLDRFTQIFFEIKPHKNYDQPWKVKNVSNAFEHKSPVKLYPWVRHLDFLDKEGNPKRVLADLQFEKLFALPANLSYIPENHIIRFQSPSTSKESAQVLAFLIKNNLGEFTATHSSRGI